MNENQLKYCFVFFFNFFIENKEKKTKRIEEEIMVIIIRDIIGENDIAIVMRMVHHEEKTITLDMSETGGIEIEMIVMIGTVLEEEKKEITNQIEGDVTPPLMLRENEREESIAMLKNKIKTMLLRLSQKGQKRMTRKVRKVQPL